VTRDAHLKRWVNQPPAGPLVEALRTAERRRAIDLLGTNDRVLDLASEAGVTREIDAAVTRVDFSPDASEYASQVLDATEFRTVDPESPDLPFDTGKFDAVVSIGPYDWKFLAVDALTDEVHRDARAGRPVRLLGADAALAVMPSPTGTPIGTTPPMKRFR
jgi:hypothetical protein